MNRVDIHVTGPRLEELYVHHLAGRAVVGNVSQTGHNSLVFVLARAAVTVENYVTAVGQVGRDKVLQTGSYLIATSPTLHLAPG